MNAQSDRAVSDAEEAEQKPPTRLMRTLKGVGIVLALGSVLSVLAIVFIVMRSEMRHRESECPFTEKSVRRHTASISVREEARSCDDDTAEHRFWLLRAGEEPRLLGGRRLPKGRYASERYSWHIEEGDRGIAIRIENVDVEDALFHELPPTRKPPGQP